MKWLEIIKLRSVGKVPELVKEFSLPMAKGGQSGLIETRTYRHAALERDWSLHLQWESERPDQNGSPLGLRLSQALKEFGLVDHSIWIEEEK